MLALPRLSLCKSLMSSNVFSEVIASMTNVHVNPLDFALASLAQLSLVRYVAVSIYYWVVELCKIVMAPQVILT